MNYSEYLEIVMQRFSKLEEVQINTFNVKSMYEEKFELKWLATKLKNFSFISYLNKIDRDDIQKYTSTCVDYALHSYKGMPRGVQNGISTFNVLVSENVSAEAKAFSIARPKKHFAAFEMPIIFDLSDQSIYYYKNTPMWGAIYYKFFREYIEKHFII